MALSNVKQLCPSLAMISINLYRSAADMFVGDSVLSSQEGTCTTQGDLLFMPVYALATLPLSKRLPTSVSQSRYADDVSSCGIIDNLHFWWNDLADLGPQYEYYANPSKTCLIMKHIHYDRAEMSLTIPTSTSQQKGDHTWKYP